MQWFSRTSERCTLLMRKKMRKKIFNMLASLNGHFRDSTQYFSHSSHRRWLYHRQKFRRKMCTRLAAQYSTKSAVLEVWNLVSILTMSLCSVALRYIVTSLGSIFFYCYALSYILSSSKILLVNLMSGFWSYTIIKINFPLFLLSWMHISQKCWVYWIF